MSSIERKAKRDRGRPLKGDRPLSAAERQAARRRRQNESEAKLARLQGDISKVFGLTEHLYAAMYDPLSPVGRELLVDQYWSRLLKAAHGAAYAAFPSVTAEQLQLAFPMIAKRVCPTHRFTLAKPRASENKAP